MFRVKTIVLGAREPWGHVESVAGRDSQCHCPLTPCNSFYLPLTPSCTKAIVCTPALLHSCTPEFLKSPLCLSVAQTNQPKQTSKRPFPHCRRGRFECQNGWHGNAQQTVFQHVDQQDNSRFGQAPTEAGPRRRSLQVEPGATVATTAHAGATMRAHPTGSTRAACRPSRRGGAWVWQGRVRRGPRMGGPKCRPCL